MAEDPFAGSFLSGLVFLGGGLAFHVLKGYCGREMDALSSARKISSISDLRRIADSKSKQERESTVAVVGQVHAENPIIAKNSRVPAVILEESLEQFFLKQVNGSNWVKDSTFLARTKRQVQWFVEDSSGRAYVEGAETAAEFSLLRASEVLEEPTPSSTVRTVLDIAQHIKVLCVKRVEEVLPVGATLTVVGEVARTDKDRLVLRKPLRGGPFFVTRKSLALLVNELGASVQWCHWISIGSTALGVISLAISAIEFFHGRRGGSQQPPGSRERPGSRRSGQLTASEGAPADSGAALAINPMTESQCVICLDREYNVAFFPCGHVCCCKECMECLTHCPLCRQRISQKKVVYLH